MLIWTLMGDRLDLGPASSPRACLAIWTLGWPWLPPTDLLCALVSEVPPLRALLSPVAPGSLSPVEQPPLTAPGTAESP